MGNIKLSHQVLYHDLQTVPLAHRECCAEIILQATENDKETKKVKLLSDVTSEHSIIYTMAPIPSEPKSVAVTASREKIMGLDEYKHQTSKNIGHCKYYKAVTIITK